MWVKTRAHSGTGQWSLVNLDQCVSIIPIYGEKDITIMACGGEGRKIELAKVDTEPEADTIMRKIESGLFSNLARIDLNPVKQSEPSGPGKAISEYDPFESQPGSDSGTTWMS